MLLSTKKFTSNHKSNEFFRYHFICDIASITYNNIQKDEDEFLPDTNGLLGVHKYVRLSDYSYMKLMKNKRIYKYSQGKCEEVVSS